MMKYSLWKTSRLHSYITTVNIILNLLLISSLLLFKITPPTFFTPFKTRSASNYLQKDCSTRNILFQCNYIIRSYLSLLFFNLLPSKRFPGKCLYAKTVCKKSVMKTNTHFIRSNHIYLIFFSVKS